MRQFKLVDKTTRKEFIINGPLPRVGDIIFIYGENELTMDVTKVVHYIHNGHEATVTETVYVEGESL